MKFRSLFVTLFLSASWASAVNLTVSPSSVAWTDQGWIEIDVTDMSSPGQMVGLFLYLDVAGNGVIDGADYPVAYFLVEDGYTNSVGAETLVDDKDGLDNSAIHTAISCHGVANDVLHTVGDYIWLAVEEGGFGPPVSDKAVFSVTQSVSSVSISGEVQDYVTHNPKPGSYVEIGYFSDTIGLAPSAWSDENGEFTLYIPDGVATDAVVGVQASSMGLMSVEFNPDTGEEISTHYFTNALSIGMNELTTPLYTLPEIASNDLYTVSGTVYLIGSGESGPETNALGGVIVETETEEEVDTFSWDITDADGRFSLVSPSNDPGGVIPFWCEGTLLNLRGIVGTLVQVDVTNTTTGVEIYCYEAEAMAKARVTDQETGEPLTGVEVYYESTDGAGFISSAYTLTNGFYEIGLRAGIYQAGCEEDSLTYRHYVQPAVSNDLVIVQDTVVTNTSFEAEPGYIISGHVYDTNNTPLGDGSVVLVEYHDGWENWRDSADTAQDGRYNLLAPTGTWYLCTDDFGDYLVDLHYTNHYTGNLDEADPVLVTTAGVSGVDFYLPSGARIEGRVQDQNLNPVSDLRVRAYRQDETGEWVCVSADHTENSGTFGFAAPAGSNIMVRTDIDYEQWFPETWYGDTCSRDAATGVLLTDLVTVSNLNIQVFPAYEVNGDVYSQAGMSAIAGATVTAFDIESNRYASVTTDGFGHYNNLFVPADVVLAVYAGAPGFEGELYQDAYLPADATGIQTSAYSYVTIPFVLYASDLDSDEDGLPDFQEDTTPDGTYNSSADYSNRNSPDTDEDGATDGSEWIAGTNPQDGDSLFEIVDAEAVPEGAFFAWASVPGREYVVQQRTNLVTGIWSNIYNVTATDGITSYTNDATLSQGYYRVRVSAP